MHHLPRIIFWSDYVCDWIFSPLFEYSKSFVEHFCPMVLTRKTGTKKHSYQHDYIVIEAQKDTLFAFLGVNIDAFGERFSFLSLLCLLSFIKGFLKPRILTRSLLLGFWALPYLFGIPPYTLASWLGKPSFKLLLYPPSSYTIVSDEQQVMVGSAPIYFVQHTPSLVLWCIASQRRGGGRSVCSQFQASFFRASSHNGQVKSACLARPTWLSGNDHEFAAKSRSALARSLSEFVQRQVAGRPVWEGLTMQLEKQFISSTNWTRQSFQGI